MLHAAIKGGVLRIALVLSLWEQKAYLRLLRVMLISAKRDLSRLFNVVGMVNFPL